MNKLEVFFQVVKQLLSTTNLEVLSLITPDKIELKTLSILNLNKNYTLTKAITYCQ